MSPGARAAWESWSVPPWTALSLLLTGLLYSAGWRRLGRLRAVHFPRWRLAAFWAGLAVIAVAVASPLDALGSLLLSAHMVQHLLLIAVAPPLVLLGCPAAPLLRGLPRALARDGLGPFLAWPPLSRLGSGLTNPAIGLGAMTVAMWAWHVPRAYEVALRSPGWHLVEHACFLAAGLLFWWPVVLPWPSRPRWPPWTMPLYLLAGDVANTILAAFLTFSDRILYPTYAAAPRLFGLSALADQSLAGVLMWVPGSLLFLGPAVILVARLVRPSGLRTRPAVPRPAAAEAPRAREPFDLLRAPLVGRVLRARFGRRAIQAAVLTLAALAIFDGFRGSPMGAMNLAGILPWTYGRGLLVIALLAAGNLFCLACPFTLPRELGKRLGLATRSWPRALRSKWLAAALLAAFFVAYERYGLWDRPGATAWILVGYFAASFAVDTFFRGASFCKYLCPIGQFQFVGSLVSPLEVRVRSLEACASCTTHDCLRGNATRRGCELDLFLPRKSGSVDCTFCLDCVQACPVDNIGILPVVPGRELVSDPTRSSVGRFAARSDLGVLALVFTVAAFASAFAMVRPGDALAFPVAAVAAVLGAAAFSPPAVRARLALATVPLGLAMWAAHLLFHLLTGWASGWPALQAALALGTPRWGGATPLLSAHGLLELQLVLLDAGLLGALYAAWRVARADGGFLPWAAVSSALWLCGVWILFQPMPMRGMVP